MSTINPQFVDQQDVRDMASLLMQMNNIPSGRQLAWLLNDGQSCNNQQVIERWLRGDMWEQLTNQPQVDLSSLSSSLQEHLDTSCNTSISECLSLQ